MNNFMQQRFYYVFSRLFMLINVFCPNKIVFIRLSHLVAMMR